MGGATQITDLQEALQAALRAVAVAGPLAAALAIAAPAAARPELTGVGEADCRALGNDEQARRGVRGEGVVECPAPPGAALLVVDNGGQIWPVLVWRSRTWPLAPAMDRHAPGENPTLGPPPPPVGAPRPPKRVEWWIRGDGEPGALTFRASWREAGDPDTWRSRLIVVRLSEDDVCVIGAFEGAGANERARAAASSDAPCAEVVEPTGTAGAR